MFVHRNASQNSKKEDGKNKKDDVQQRIEVVVLYFNAFFQHKLSVIRNIIFT